MSSLIALYFLKYDWLLNSCLFKTSRTQKGNISVAMWQSKCAKGGFVQFWENQQQWFTLLAGLDYNMVNWFPQGGRKDGSPTLLCGHRGSSDLCQDSSSPCIQYKENFSLDHQYCCCRGFKSGNPNVAFSGSVKEWKLWNKRTHHPETE